MNYVEYEKISDVPKIKPFFFLLILIMLTIGFYGYKSSSSINNNLDAIFSNALPGMDYLIEADRDLQQMLVAERTATFGAISQDLRDSQIEDLVTNRDQVFERFDKYSALSQTSEEKALIKKFNDAKDDWYPVSEEILSLIRQGTPESLDEAEALSLSEGAERFETMRDYIDQLTGVILAQAENERMESQSTFNTLKITLITLIIIGIIISTVIAIILSTSISVQLNALVNQLKDLAKGEGDLTKRIQIRTNDEFKDLGFWFNQFMDNLHDMIVKVKLSAMNSSSIAEELSSSAQEVNASTEQVSATVQEIAKGGQNLSKSANMTKQQSDLLMESIKEVSESSKISAKEAVETDNAAKKGKESAKKAGEVMQKILESSNLTSKNITQLDAKSSEIGKIIEVINDISEQTNLLALNAAIEAARAGEAGKGFAVVADEVRKLAEESQNATKQIDSMIKSIQEGTSTSVEQMNNSNKVIGEGSKVLEEAINSLETISNNVSKVTALIEKISSSTDTQMERSVGVQKIINEVSSIAEESAASTEEMSASVEETTGSMQQVANSSQILAKEANELSELVSKFKVKEEAKQEPSKA